MNPPTLEQLLEIILHSLDKKGEIFDIPEKLFYKHWHYHSLYTEKHGKQVHNPIGISAGPHTQLTQNIVTGWLCGARFIELKTVQPNEVNDRTKPSIDILDGAFNCEQSHELSIEQAYDQYLNAWIIIHILHHKLYLDAYKLKNIGTIFNMSLGYTLADIRSEKIQWFVDKMMDCSTEKAEKIQKIRKLYPDIGKVDIPDQISDSFTINTPRGCSARELEYICKFLVIDKKLHPTIKFSPTLLGYRSVMAILSAENSFDIELSEEDFDDNIQYGEAIILIENLLKITKELGRELTIKIANSLTCKNTSSNIPGSSQEVFLSGRALHPIAVNLAAKFQSKFEGLLDLSFSGGADSFNIVRLIQSGFSAITVCTDLLKPGGYGRLAQYFNELSKAFANYQAKNIRELILKSGSEYGAKESALENLRNYAIQTLNDTAYQKNDLTGLDIKSKRTLLHYDCISAPCQDASPLNSDVSGYCWFTSQNDAEKAFQTILNENPLPSILGTIGEDPSQQICVRKNYDYPVLMKEVERFISEFGPEENPEMVTVAKNKIEVAIVGGGISGLSCAWYLSSYGFSVNIYEAESSAGGMVTKLIPGFRISDAAIIRDIQRIKNSGVKILYSTEIDKERFERIRKTYSYIYVSTGASTAQKLKIEGEDAEGVIDPFTFLSNAKSDKDYKPGNKIAVIGNNWLAADAVRTAKRLAGSDGDVVLITNGNQVDMPLDNATMKALIDEDIEVLENCQATKLIVTDGKVTAIELIDTEPVEQKRSKAIKYKNIADTEETFEFDIIIPCLEPKPHTGFVDIRKMKVSDDSHATKLKQVFAGGAILNPDASILEVVADGKAAAREIAIAAGIDISVTEKQLEKKIDIRQLKLKRVQREKPNFPETSSQEQGIDFNPVVKTLKPVQALKEAARCIHCDVLCNICVNVCPNRAMFAFNIDEKDILIPTVTLNDEDFFVAYPNKLNIKQKQQVLNIVDWCNECGNCTTFCPTAGSPNKDKLRLHFDRETFNKESEGLLLTHTDNNHDLILKKNGALATLTENWDAFIFENDDCMAVLEKETFKIQQITVFTDNIDIIDLPEITEMKVLYKAVKKLI